MTIEVWIWVSIAVTFGALIQGSLGFGMNIVVAPLIGILHPELLPGGIILLGAAASVTVLVQNLKHLDLISLRWAILGRVPGTLVGVSIVVIATQNQLGIACGLSVLFAVAVLLKGKRLPPTPRNLAAGGFASGVMGASTAIGGPPMALVLMEQQPQTLRATMSAFLSFGTSLAAILLTITGQITLDHAGQVLTLAPALGTGTLLARQIAKHMDPQRARYAVICASSLSALALIGKSVSSIL